MISIKTCISTSKDMLDLNGQWLPNGNYYFTITKFKDDKYTGMIKCRELTAEYTFNGIQVISMMAQSQARLIRRTKLSSESPMPKYNSPSTSPVLSYPKRLDKFKLSKTIFGNSLKLEEPKCPICLCDIDNDSNKKKLKCSHEFHRFCINKWLLKNDTCPVCRHNVKKKSKLRKYSSLPRIVRGNDI